MAFLWNKKAFIVFFPLFFVANTFFIIMWKQLSSRKVIQRYTPKWKYIMYDTCDCFYAFSMCTALTSGVGRSMCPSARGATHTSVPTSSSRQGDVKECHRPARRKSRLPGQTMLMMNFDPYSYMSHKTTISQKVWVWRMLFLYCIVLIDSFVTCNLKQVHVCHIFTFTYVSSIAILTFFPDFLLMHDKCLKKLQLLHKT